MRNYVKETWITSGKIDDKRFHLSGVIIERECPNCKDMVEKDLSRDYLDFPPMNEEFKLQMYCGKCDHEFFITAQLKVKLEVYE